MTIRKFHLLLAEWRYSQQLQDIRAYQILRTNLTKQPKPEEIFPDLANLPSVDEELDPDTDVIISQSGSTQSFNF